jgi:hypothetical protein
MPPNLRRELVRVRRRTDRGDDRVAAARGDERAGEQDIPRLLLDGLRLAGEQRFVDREVDRVEHGCIRDDLVAGAQHHRVAEHHLIGRHRAERAVAQHRHHGRCEQREPVERELRAHLLHDADGRIADHDAEEQAVAQVAEDQDEHEARREDGVEQREDVVADDVPQRARGRALRDVRFAARDGGGYLTTAEAVHTPFA